MRPPYDWGQLYGVLNTETGEWAKTIGGKDLTCTTLRAAIFALSSFGDTREEEVRLYPSGEKL